MAYNKVILKENGTSRTLIDLSSDTVDSDKALSGISFHKKNGVSGTGSLSSYTPSSITNSNLLVTIPTGVMTKPSTIEITWNGDRFGPVKVAYNEHGAWYKVSNSYITTTSQVIGGTCYLSGSSSSNAINSSNVTSGTGYIAVAHTGMWGQTAVFVSSPNATYLSKVFPEVGTYLYSDGIVWISKIVLNTTTSIYTDVEKVLTDSNFIPENIKKDVSLFGLTGTFEGGSGGGEKYEELVVGTLSIASGSMSTIRPYAFASCPNLTTASFPACTSIGSNAFGSCTSLTAVSFPVCITLSSSAFYNCSRLTSVYFPVCTTIASNAFAYCYTLATALFPLCTSISSYALSSCSNLTTVSFPVCASIGGYVFAGCYSLTTASFPVCKTIGSYAFRSCTRLLSLYLLGSSVPTLSNSNAFTSTPISDYTTSTGGVQGSIIVQASMLEAFKAATNWSVYSARFSVWNGTD